MIKSINLVKVNQDPSEVIEALVFYVSYGVTTVEYTAAERELHYNTLEQAGYLSKLDMSH